MSDVVLCRPDEYLSRRLFHCPTCQCLRRFAVRTAVWYGATATCCHCGDSWTDRQRMERPFRRGWRRESAARARKDWVAAGPNDRHRWRTWLSEQLGAS